MACESCRSQTRLLVRAATKLSKAPTPTASLAISKRYLSSISNGQQSNAQNAIQSRAFSSTPSRNLFQNLTSTYMVVGATERLFKGCGEAANYKIPADARKEDRVEKLEDGEEIGEATGTKEVWHKLFKLPPTFSTWSHVTMLHLYLLNARLRCFEAEAYTNWRQQLIDHFFFEAEKKMHVDHGITSSALRQRYLKDIFVQWRGLLIAYDEGLIKGDAILASAVWRNLFKGDADADPRALAAIVGWMRSCLKALEGTSDEAFPRRAGEILEVPVESFWAGIEKATKGAGAAAEGEKVEVGGKTDGPLKERVVVEPQVGKQRG